MEHPFPDAPHVVANEGTAAHSLALECFSSGNDAVAYHGAILSNGVEADDAMVEGVQMYLDEVRGKSSTNRYIETTLAADWIHQGLAPTPDAWDFDQEANTLRLWDLKYGWRAVEAEDNWQLTVYLFAALKYLETQGIYPAHIEATIVQPRVPHYDGRIRTWRTTPGDLGEKFLILQTKAAEAMGGTPTCTTGAWCRDCKALAVCPASRDAAAAAIEASSRAVASEPIPAELAAELEILKTAERALALRLTALETVAIDFIGKGGLVPNWATERALGKRRWRVEDKELHAVSAMTGVDLFVTEPVTPAQAERAGLGKETVALYVTTPEGKLKLVKRDLAAKASKVFGDNSK